MSGPPIIRLAHRGRPSSPFPLQGGRGRYGAATRQPSSELWESGWQGPRPPEWTAGAPQPPRAIWFLPQGAQAPAPRGEQVTLGRLRGAMLDSACEDSRSVCHLAGLHLQPAQAPLPVGHSAHPSPISP